MSPAEKAVRRIVEQYGRPQPGTGSALLDTISNLKPDRHDVAGAITIAEEAMAADGEDDAFREALGRIVDMKRSDKRYDRHDMSGILAVCGEAIDAEPEPTAPRP